MCMCMCEFVQMHVYMYTMGLLLRWLAHLMLYCTDEAKIKPKQLSAVALLAPIFEAYVHIYVYLV